MNNQTAFVLNYHNLTKHSLERYARGPETIDWEDQPDQFRRFNGCDIVELPHPGKELDVLFTDLDKPESIPASSLNLVNVGLLLELAFGLSAWKQFGPSRWALRCNPSSGNLHPTEAYLINTESNLAKPGVYHYVSHDHHLERRCLFNQDIPGADILIGLSSVHWREAWKYGERAYRYCQHDTGHALGALRYAAATLGWSIELLAEWSDDDIATMLGLNRADGFKKMEGESPDLICRINTGSNNTPVDIEAILESAQSGEWYGLAASLRAYHFYKWPIIDEVALAASKPLTEEHQWKSIKQELIIEDQSNLIPGMVRQAFMPFRVHHERNQRPAVRPELVEGHIQPLHKSPCTKPATAIIRQRRSAQQFDGKMSPLPLTDFHRMLVAVLPASTIPFDMWRWSPKIHLFFFVHRVEGLEPGLYGLPRSDLALEKLRSATLPDFAWQQVNATSENSFTALPLYHLYFGNCRQIAKTLSCHQPIASDSAFSLAMVAEFGETIEATPWLYRRLFWECGLIGQVLYLEAEAAGVRGTGIGCYFDDSVHEILGLKDNTFQSLYHFTIGKPLEDKRLETLPPYGHLNAK
ncbi:MAG: SagB/ThcOx family dehydrogenase [Methyloglobulus sp.]